MSGAESSNLIPQLAEKKLFIRSMIIILPSTAKDSTSGPGKTCKSNTQIGCFISSDFAGESANVVGFKITSGMTEQWNLSEKGGEKFGRNFIWAIKLNFEPKWELLVQAKGTNCGEPLGTGRDSES